MIQLLLLISALVTVAVLVILASAVIAGLVLCIATPYRTVGTFVLLVPTLAAVAAVTGSWGLAFLLNSLATNARSVQGMQTLGVLTLWAWPVGFVAGALLGAGVGTLAAVLIVRRGRRRRIRETV